MSSIDGVWVAISIYNFTADQFQKHAKGGTASFSKSEVRTYKCMWLV